MSKNDDDFGPGDIVSLRSGGPAMTVTQIGPGTLPPSNGREARALDVDDIVCSWFPGTSGSGWYSELQTETFKRWCVRHCRADELEQRKEIRDVTAPDQNPQPL